MKKVVAVLLSAMCLLFVGCEDKDEYVNLDQYVTYDRYSYYAMISGLHYTNPDKHYYGYLFKKYYEKEIENTSVILETDGYVYYNKYSDENNFDEYIEYDYILMSWSFSGWQYGLEIDVEIFDEFPPPEYLQVKITYSFVGETEIHEEVADLDFTEQSLQEKYIKK